MESNQLVHIPDYYVSKIIDDIEKMEIEDNNSNINYKNENEENHLGQDLDINRLIFMTESGVFLSTLFDYDKYKVNDILNQQIMLLKSSLQYQDLNKVTKFMRNIRKSISFNDKPHLLPLIETDIIPNLIMLLDEKYKEFFELQFETAWIITNFATLENNIVQSYLLNNDGIKKFLKLLTHEDKDMKALVRLILFKIKFFKVHDSYC